MGTVIIDLAQLKREKEAEWRRNITWKEIHEATGIAETTLNGLFHDKTKRVDLSVAARLCDFFEMPAGPISFLVYQPNGKQQNT